MRLQDFFSKITKDKVPFIAGGILVGVLGLWVLGKVLGPWMKPVIKDACLTYLDMKQSRQGGGERIVDVEAVRVATGTMTKRITTIGKLRANEEVMLRSEMAGRITEISFKEGEAVEKGDVLIRFEDADAAAEVTLAEAELALRQADYDRIAKLHSQKIESVKKFDEVKAHLETAKAKLEKAKAQLEKTKIVAPFSGNIGLIDVSVGAYVQAAQDLVKLVDNSPIKIDFKVPEQNVHDVGVGQTAEMILDGFAGETFIATVASVDASLDAVSHSLSLRATCPNDDGRLRAGMFASISLIVGEKGNTIMVPESAVTRDGDREFVWAVHSGRAGRRRVITGTREKGKVEILQGLRSDELVVTAGQIKLGEGTSINITNLESLEEALKEEGETSVTPAKTASAAEPVKDSPTAEVKKEVSATTSQPAKETEKANDSPQSSASATAEKPQENTSKIGKVFSSLKGLFSKTEKEETAAEAPKQETRAEAQQPIEPIAVEKPQENAGVMAKIFSSLKNLFSKNKE